MFFRSHQAADCIKIKLGLLLVILTTTRWNSVYDAVCRLKTCFENREKRAALDRVCNTQSSSFFSWLVHDFYALFESAFQSQNIRCFERVAYCFYWKLACSQNFFTLRQSFLHT